MARINEPPFGQVPRVSPLASALRGGASLAVRDNPGSESYPNQPAGPTTTTAAPNAATTPDAAAPDPYDYSQDPILQNIQAFDVKARADARAAALAQRNQLAIAYGDATGISDDASTAEAARNNPFSTLADLLHGYQDTTHQHGEDLNQQNLWYSGAHVKQGVDDANAYQHQTYDARQQELAQLGQIDSGLVSALYGADQGDIGAEGDAAARAQQRAQLYGIDPGAASGAAAAPPGSAGSVAAGLGRSLTVPSSLPKTGYRVPVATSPRPKVSQPKAAALTDPYKTNPSKRG